MARATIAIDFLAIIDTYRRTQAKLEKSQGKIQKETVNMLIINEELVLAELDRYDASILA
ncbi:hypothetical protein N7448_001889 [Penicillium atrosanguineum]|uniref:Uncharacterized protein n=1 Tax=Penicillium atrosanguineum TaxID=1132637 RepID=A0A9W9HKL0_9EURO|nr:Thiolase [Penicillium atrosanguineum]KAJ5133082.1 hypothetical protein N7526_004447 [Penicillium atrosanguineum]KAJ5150311.1 hypothetical protein N7448_001889 [Penicillium atrosanguineum]KAJ5305627.1 Thiolase [Penicillium atrosanguineum]KAJ5325089.1 hypothetical protein N7476_003689 [Penicillium atrosanguineum]